MRSDPPDLRDKVVAEEFMDDDGVPTESEAAEIIKMSSANLVKFADNALGTAQRLRAQAAYWQKEHDLVMEFLGEDQRPARVD